MHNDEGNVDEYKVIRNSFLWNTVASVLNASQSFLFLWVVTRAIGVEEAGFFSFAFAIANQCLTIGKYGMRNFQVTDTKFSYSFHTYFKSRIITTTCMILVSICYCVYLLFLNRYDGIKVAVLLLLCFWRVIDSVDDVFQGLYQQLGRLDIGAYWLSIRTGVTMLIFCLMVFLKKQLVLPMLFMLLISLLLLIFFIRKTYPVYGVAEKKQSAGSNGVWRLLWETLPLFIITFLGFYINNCGKYAVASLGDDTIQAMYGYISMPLLFIGFLNNFFFQPILTKLAMEYNNNRVNEFKNMLMRQISIFIAISVVALVGGDIFGIPILSVFYKVDLRGYKVEFLLLLVSGCFAFLAGGLLYNVLVLMREKRGVLLLYAAFSAFGVFVSGWVVKRYDMMGAVVLQLGLMVLLSAFFAVLVCVKLWLRKADLLKLDV